LRRCITKKGLKLRDNLLLVAYLDIRESLRSKWFYLYSFVFGGVMGLFFLSGVTDSVVMGLLVDFSPTTISNLIPNLPIRWNNLPQFLKDLNLTTCKGPNIPAE